MELKQTLVNEICPTTTQVWIKRGAILVDVREKDEVEQLAYNVPNIVNIPLSEFETRFKELPLDKELVMVCRGGGRSLRAAGFLINNGYDPLKVANMQHGIIRWVQKGFITKGDTTTVTGTNTDIGCCGTTAPKDKSSCCDSPNGDGSACC
ncbi:MAG: rhodanese-like domain-containing protein [Ferruginibacter sp.]